VAEESDFDGVADGEKSLLHILYMDTTDAYNGYLDSGVRGQRGRRDPVITSTIKIRQGS
jgi:hypothetical protein